MIPGRFFMHCNAMDVCAEVLDVSDEGLSTVRWWNLGYSGSPWICADGYDRVYINGNWRDITTLLNIPRKRWPAWQAVQP